MAEALNLTLLSRPVAHHAHTLWGVVSDSTYMIGSCLTHPGCGDSYRWVLLHRCHHICDYPLRIIAPVRFVREIGSFYNFRVLVGTRLVTPVFRTVLLICRPRQCKMIWIWGGVNSCVLDLSRMSRCSIQRASTEFHF